MKISIILLLILSLTIFLIFISILNKEKFTFADYNYVTKDGKNVNMFANCFCPRNIDII